ncbi:hypothetical protein L873DRAFT_1725610, partial [Choiromyces venosus 120613-1]
WQRDASKQDRLATNRKLFEKQELAVHQYLDRLDAVGTSAKKILHLMHRLRCANAILQNAYIGPLPAPVVCDHWAQHFLSRYPEYSIRKQCAIDIDRKNAHQPYEI